MKLGTYESLAEERHKLHGRSPSHWSVYPLKRVAEFTEGPGIMAADFHDEGIPLLRISSIQERIASLRGCNYLDTDLVAKRWRHFRVKRNDLLISGSASTGLCSEVDETTEGAVPYTGIIIIRPVPKFAKKEFLRWFFLSDQFETQVILAKTGSTIQHYGPTHLSRMSIVMPVPDEQEQIARFLDVSVGKIDTLVSKKRELIDLLQEKRRALVSRCVTRGLPPDAARAAGLDPQPKLKPSGIQWIGEVPDHWLIKKGRYLGTLLGSTNPSEDDYVEDDSGLRFAKVNDLNYLSRPFELTKTKARITGHPIRNREIILFPKRGAAIFTNKVAVASGLIHFDTNLMGWQMFAKYLPRYVAYSLSARRLDDLADVSTVPQINNKHVYPAFFAVPPTKDEQVEIVTFLDGQMEKFERLERSVQAMIDTLLEYRSALITAAVTGKIDVREVEV